MKSITKLFATMLLIVAASWAIAAGQININTADAQTLAAELKGIGDKKAQAIVDYRSEHGAFKSVDDLSEVKGIGDKFLQDNADRIIVEGE
ncbi:MAG: helix-hairpin-helix domain-containing protein [Gammaproteobacteria bacterium]|nr:helix-hairpin-helix domain-containing protein [Gammaproteobacteria bacterium]